MPKKNHYPHTIVVRLSDEDYNVVKANPTNVIRNLIYNHVLKYQTAPRQQQGSRRPNPERNQNKT